MEESREIINGYELLEPLKNKNAGFSRWTFAKKDGTEWFLKEFLDPVFPTDSKIGATQLFVRRQACRDFEKKRIDLYTAVNSSSDGNIIRVQEFFRHGSRYYITMERVPGEPISIPRLMHLPMGVRMQLCRVIAHSVACLHEKRIVHSDIKDRNIMIKKTAMQTFTAKIIDFDCSFLEDVPPQRESELGGDQIYLSPEACLFLCGEETKLTTKMDVFSLGILFHQYLTGYVPWYDTGEFDYLHEAVLEGAKAGVSEKVPAEWRPVIEQMLIGDPEQRCSIEDVCRKIIPGYRSIDVNANAGNGFIFAENLGGL